MATPVIKEQDPEVLASLFLDGLNHKIDRCLWGYENGGTSQGRKSFFKRLVMLEGTRELEHGVPQNIEHFEQGEARIMSFGCNTPNKSFPRFAGRLDSGVRPASALL